MIEVCICTVCPCMAVEDILSADSYNMVNHDSVRCCDNLTSLAKKDHDDDDCDGSWRISLLCPAMPVRIGESSRVEQTGVEQTSDPTMHMRVKSQWGKIATSKTVSLVTYVSPLAFPDIPFHKCPSPSSQTAVSAWPAN